MVASKDATAGKHHNIRRIINFQITLEIIFVTFSEVILEYFLCGTGYES
jgi:hypothetical protein